MKEMKAFKQLLDDKIVNWEAIDRNNEKKVERTYSTCGEMMGKTRERIRQVLAKAITKIRRNPLMRQQLKQDSFNEESFEERDTKAEIHRTLHRQPSEHSMSYRELLM